MDALSPALVLPLSRVPSFEKPTPTCFPSHSQNHSLRFFSSINRTNPTLYLISKFRTPQTLVSRSSITHEAVDKVSSPTLREMCESHVPQHILDRMEEIGYVIPTDVQRQALPSLFTGRDCILHAQTGSGKTLTYLLLIYSVIKTAKSAVQALVVVPTRELGMQVSKVARILAAKRMEVEGEQKSCKVMALLDGGTLRRHKSWLKLLNSTEDYRILFSIFLETMGRKIKMLLACCLFISV